MHHKPVKSCKTLRQTVVRYKGHSKSYLPDHLTIMLAFSFWQSIIDYTKYITATEYQLARYLVTCHMTLVVCLICLLLWTVVVHSPWQFRVIFHQISAPFELFAPNQILAKLVLCCNNVLNVVYDTMPKAEGQRYCKMIIR